MTQIHCRLCSGTIAPTDQCVQKGHRYYHPACWATLNTSTATTPAPIKLTYDQVKLELATVLVAHARMVKTRNIESSRIRFAAEDDFNAANARLQAMLKELTT